MAIDRQAGKPDRHVRPAGFPTAGGGHRIRPMAPARVARACRPRVSPARVVRAPGITPGVEAATACARSVLPRAMASPPRRRRALSTGGRPPATTPFLPGRSSIPIYGRFQAPLGNRPPMRLSNQQPPLSVPRQSTGYRPLTKGAKTTASRTPMRVVPHAVNAVRAASRAFDAWPRIYPVQPHEGAK